MRLDIFYQSGWFIQYQTNMRFTFVELLGWLYLSNKVSS